MGGLVEADNVSDCAPTTCTHDIPVRSARTRSALFGTRVFADGVGSAVYVVLDFGFLRRSGVAWVVSAGEVAVH